MTSYQGGAVVDFSARRHVSLDIFVEFHNASK